MRKLCLLPLSAILLSACLTTQENPNYEHSTVYRGDSAATTQYASTAPVEATSVSYDPAPISYQQSASYSQPATYESAPIYAHSAPEIPALPPSFDYNSPTAATSMAIASAPTDSAYSAQDVTGTPGFMAMQNQQQAVAQAELAPVLPQVQSVDYAPLRAAGTPVSYDYSRNLIAADAITTGQSLPESVRVLSGGSQNYTVQPGDTVYSLSRRTCVGVNVIQSMNGLGADYGINIGQSIQLPTSVC